MTREEAIAILENEKNCVNRANKNDYCNRDCYNCELVKTDTEILNALDMAIKALEQESCEDWHDISSDEMTLEQARQAVRDLRKMWAEHLEQEPCEDEYIKVPKKALKYRTAGMIAYNAEWLKNHFDMERAVICGEQEPKTGQWIPVSERLPKYNKTVLISVKPQGKEEMVFTAQRRRRVKTPDIFKCCTDYDGWWDFSIATWDNHEVLAWMPLPEPYRAESEDKE